MARRYDRATLLSAVRTPEGFVLAEGFAARPGILTYRNPDGSTRRELVRADALARPADVATLARKPVTLGHPPEFVTAENVDRYGVGDVDGEVTIADDGFVRVKVAIRRVDAVDAVDAGRVELSCGYDVDLDPTPGVDPVFGAYDAVQIARRYNHLAIVDRARGGAALRLRLDADDLVEDDPTTAAPPAPPEAPLKFHPAVIALLAAGSLRRSDGLAADADVGEGVTLDVVAPAAAAKVEAPAAAEKKTDAADPAGATEKKTDEARTDGLDGARFDGRVATSAPARPRVSANIAHYNEVFSKTLR